MNQVKQRVRVVTVRKITGKKSIKDKVYTYEYYTLSLNLYVPKDVVERYGSEFVIIKDEEKNIITIIPKKIAEEQGIKVE
ncbi:MAG: hypothetical protein LM582_04010 [Desulfurococcaceae archaeon]|jgi:hypothetical protein|nr:hypothetical protein [Desulfurococcaceae archaeon]MCC6057362.1 hypothetical protein [Desulfurococcaceae archaeon]